jgi:hypothetical protein
LRLSPPDQLQHAQYVASDTAALRTLQPHDHSKPKHAHKILSLSTRTRAAPQTTSGGVGAMQQARIHDGDKTQSQTGLELLDVSAAIDSCDAGRGNLDSAGSEHQRQHSSPVNAHAGHAANHTRRAPSGAQPADA